MEQQCLHLRLYGCEALGIVDYLGLLTPFSLSRSLGLRRILRSRRQFMR